MLLLDRQVIQYPKAETSAVVRNMRSYKREIIYYAKRDGSVEVRVLDGVSGKKLFTANRRATKGKNSFTLDLTSLAEQRIFLYTVIVKGKDFQEEHRIKLEEKLRQQQ